MKITASYNRNGFRFQASDGSDGSNHYDRMVRDWGKRLKDDSSDANHRLFAYQIVEPLKTVSDYEEWTAPFFSKVPGDTFNPHRFASDSGYTATSWVTSPDGRPMMLRPGRTTFSSVSPNRYQTGLELDVDQVEAAGWDITSRKIEEAGFELARKRDSVRNALMDTAVVATGGEHVATVATNLTYASVRSIMQNAADDLYKPTFMVINPKLLWEMGDWTLPANSMWQTPPELGQEVVLNNGYFTNLFNLQVFTFESAPTDEVWFGNRVGQDYEIVYRDTEPAVKADPIARNAQYSWIEDTAHLVRSGLRLWRLTIT